MLLKENIIILIIIDGVEKTKRKENFSFRAEATSDS